ncbi:MAG: DMT family transporter [Planctomycetaceae bacterium]|jgi:small multidrug resistance pump
MNPWLCLALAIVCEVAGTSALQASAGFTRPLPSLLVTAGYGLAFYFLSQTLTAIPLGTAYAIWSGVGTALIAAIGWVVYGQKLDLAAIAGIVLITAGVLVIHLFSQAHA